MEEMKAGELKTILHSKRAQMFYLEHCRLEYAQGRLVYLTAAEKRAEYRNIPVANTTVLLLGNGTSITQMAVRECVRAGVVVGFCGSEGTPLYAAEDFVHDVEWLLPQSEYRPTEYLQAWMGLWSDPQLRLQAARQLQLLRIRFVEQMWTAGKHLVDEGFRCDRGLLSRTLESYVRAVQAAADTTGLFCVEAEFTKKLYRLALQAVGSTQEFQRVKRGAGTDLANKFLDKGNYFAYGLGASATWVLGLPHGLSVMHGKTRRGGLVFDAADVIKDALVLPAAFVAAQQNMEKSASQQFCKKVLFRNDALQHIFESLKQVAELQQRGELARHVGAHPE